MTPRRADEAREPFAAAAIRAFVALDLDAAVRRALAERLAGLRAAVGDGAVRWVRPESLHVTLRFLGQTAPERIPTIVAQLRAAAAACAPFRLALGAVAGFPSSRRPRVIACAIEPCEELAQLAQAVEAAVVRAGCAPDPRPFRGHLTLGRISGRLRRPVTAAVTAVGEALRVNEIVLFRSELAQSGAVYTPLERIALGGSNHP